MPPPYTSQIVFVWHIHMRYMTHSMCAITHSYACHGWPICAQRDCCDSSHLEYVWLIHIRATTHSMRAMTCSYRCRDSPICVYRCSDSSQLVFVWLRHIIISVTYSYPGHQSFYACHDPFTWVPWLTQMRWMSAPTHHNQYVCDLVIWVPRLILRVP